MQLLGDSELEHDVSYLLHPNPEGCLVTEEDGIYISR